MIVEEVDSESNFAVDEDVRHVFQCQCVSPHSESCTGE